MQAIQSSVARRGMNSRTRWAVRVRRRYWNNLGHFDQRRLSASASYGAASCKHDTNGGEHAPVAMRMTSGFSSPP